MLRALTYFVLTAFIAFVNSDNVKFYQEKNYHKAKELTDLEIRNLASRSDEAHFRSALNEILVPRVVGTPAHTKVGNFIRDHMKSFGWSVEEDVFVDKTPNMGSLTFRNIIATVNPNADRYLVLACHYDSKYTREYDFFGATDSAAPCAMMLNLAKVLAKELSTLQQSKLSLMFIFFDGEEAFRSWGPTDSIYGARHLANKWFNKSYKDGANHLQRMDMLVLLDLLGAPDPVFYSYFHQTEKWYVKLAEAEQKLAAMDLLTGYSKGRAEQTYFRLSSSRSFVEDDHVPFMRKSVNILHLIPSPFPDVWHKSGDNINALDFKTIDNLNKIIRVFVAQYLNLSPETV